jgi:hypothetical protein
MIWVFWFPSCAFVFSVIQLLEFPLRPSAKNAAIAPPSNISAPIADDRQALFK